MAAAQEFASPGEHMASIASSGPARSHGPNDFIDSPHSQVIYAPHYDNLNNTFEDFADSYGIGGSARSYRERSYNFNKDYMDYNDRLFNSAKDYDMYMSNTAIQRQIADLKAAGLNPILAAYLGGAQYKGVNAPYIGINPASALQAYTGYDSSIYSTNVGSMTQRDVARIQTSSNEFISSYRALVDRQNVLDKIDADKYIQNVQNNFNEYIELLKTADNAFLKNLGFENEKSLIDYQHSVNVDFYNLKFGKENFGEWSVKLGNLITGLSPFAALSQISLPSFGSNAFGFTG